jgi:hypothetical protein
LRFLAIEVGLPIGRKRNNTNSSLADYRACRRLGVKAVALTEPSVHGWPEATAHERVDLGQALPLQDDRLGGPLSGARAEHPASNFRFVRIERKRMVDSRHLKASHKA